MMIRPYVQHRMQGISLIAVLFILIVLGGLAGVMAQMGATQHVGMLLSQQGKQAFYVARSGLEWGRYQVLEQQACYPDSQAEMAGFQLQLSCQSTDIYEGLNLLRIYHLQAQVSQETPFGVVQRETEATIWSIIP